jgi:PIN domain nuclease of toxin-antitoxin system
LLVDSHVALWWLDDHPSLGPICRRRIEFADLVVFSAVTPWELGVKQQLGKLDFPVGLTSALTDSGFSELAISAVHAERAATLPAHHRDQFDRMLVAQAQIEEFVLVSADRSLQPYDVDLLDALA